jgi:hypothetical protein
MTTTAATKSLAYRVLGTTDEVTECELCGRQELKGTIVLAVLDADGNDEEVVYYGASCGAKAAGWTTPAVRKAAKDADQAKRDAEHADRMAKMAAEDALFVEWLFVNYNTRDRIEAAKMRGERTAIALWSDFDAQRVN